MNDTLRYKQLLHQYDIHLVKPVILQSSKSMKKSPLWVVFIKTN